MSNQRKLLESRPCEGLRDATHIDVELYYTKGGANYLSGGAAPRGYYLSVKPVSRNGVSVSFILFSGVSKLMMAANRFSAKQFEQAAELARAAAPELIELVIKEERAA